MNDLCLNIYIIYFFTSYYLVIIGFSNNFNAIEIFVEFLLDFLMLNIKNTRSYRVEFLSKVLFVLKSYLMFQSATQYSANGFMACVTKVTKNFINKKVYFYGKLY